MALARILIVLLTTLLTAAHGHTDTLTGLDVLVRDDYTALAGQRVGLITNHTGVDRAGVSAINRLHAADNVALIRIFSPEHGITGQLDQAVIGDSRDAASRLPVVSLYGEHRRPTAASLGGLDTLVFDIQDIGTRFYTYISTMGYAMEAASEHGLRFVVLDRPNPINGVDVAGPVLDDGEQTFTGFHTLPVRHGMTVGELARLFNAELDLGLDLTVVPVEGWTRARYYDETGIAWIDPSPNMQSLEAAILYPGIGLLETTNLSVGRGTATPFEVLGAPWLDGAALTRHLNDAGLRGARFAAVTYTPDASKFRDETVHGVAITVTDRAAIEPLAIGFEIAHYLVNEYPDAWDTTRYPLLLRDAAVLQAVRDGKPVTAIRERYAAELARFIERRAPFLLYD